MPLYFMHLRDSIDELLDPEGIEISTEAVAAKALSSARDCMAEDIKEGRLDLRYRIDVHAENGELVHSVPFASAVEIIPPA